MQFKVHGWFQLQQRNQLMTTIFLI